MILRKLKYVIIAFAVIIFNQLEAQCPQTVTDIDGNVYKM